MGTGMLMLWASPGQVQPLGTGRTAGAWLHPQPPAKWDGGNRDSASSPAGWGVGGGSLGPSTGPAGRAVLAQAPPEATGNCLRLRASPLPQHHHLPHPGSTAGGVHGIPAAPAPLCRPILAPAVFGFCSSSSFGSFVFPAWRGGRGVVEVSRGLLLSLGSRLPQVPAPLQLHECP